MLGTNYFDCFLFTKRFGNNHSSLTSPAGPFIMLAPSKLSELGNRQNNNNNNNNNISKQRRAEEITK